MMSAFRDDGVTRNFYRTWSSFDVLHVEHDLSGVVLYLMTHRLWSWIQEYRVSVGVELLGTPGIDEIVLISDELHPPFEVGAHVHAHFLAYSLGTSATCDAGVKFCDDGVYSRAAENL